MYSGPGREGNDSRNIGQGETRGESADWAAGQVGGICGKVRKLF